MPQSLLESIADVMASEIEENNIGAVSTVDKKYYLVKWTILLNGTRWKGFRKCECAPSTPVILTYSNYLAFVVINQF
jgi:hypothetical protein